MRIIPVMDVKGGFVVRAVGGRRDEYRRLASPLCEFPDPVLLAQAFHARFGYQELYIADLDAIAGAPPALSLFTDLHAKGFELWIDAGIETAADVAPLADAGIDKIIVGLETVRGPDEVRQIAENWHERIVFSLDLKAGLVLGDASPWGTSAALEIAEQVIALGVRRLIVLDLARVGLDQGVGTEDLCTRLARKYREVEIVAGGGIRDRHDLVRMQETGVSALLVSSALHAGRLP